MLVNFILLFGLCFVSVAVNGFGIHNLQALPIYLDKLFNQYLAIILSVTFVLAFGEVCMLFY
jgi:hypothetical protein